MAVVEAEEVREQAQAWILRAQLRALQQALGLRQVVAQLELPQGPEPAARPPIGPGAARCSPPASTCTRLKPNSVAKHLAITFFP